MPAAHARAEPRHGQHAGALALPRRRARAGLRVPPDAPRHAPARVPWCAGLCTSSALPLVPTYQLRGVIKAY